MRALLFIFPLFFLLSCNDVENTYITEFSYSEGQSFKYSLKAYLTTDSDTTLMDDLEYIFEVVSTSAAVGEKKNLIEFKVYSTNSPESYFTTSWYEQTNRGFYDYAYRNAGIDPGIQPKSNSLFTLPELLSLVHPSYSFAESMVPLNQAIDSTIIRDDIRLTVPFPLQLKTRSWVEFTDPFLRESEVISDTVFTIQGRQLNAIKVKSVLPDFDLVTVYSYFSEYGMISRKIISTGNVVTDEDDPEPNGAAYTSAAVVIELIDFDL